jgi:uncharacterized protein (DUF488 family)
MKTILTVGHSTHSMAKFLALLDTHRVTAVADVRSMPYSRMNRQFNRETLQADLKRKNIAYVFLGRELGARTEDRSCYVTGKVQYDRLAATALFRDGLERVRRGADEHRIALLCAEKDPLTCHRCILVGRQLIESGVDVQHILADGRLETHTAALKRLVSELHIEQAELFGAPRDILTEAYRLRGEQIAYVEKHADEPLTDEAR